MGVLGKQIAIYLSLALVCAAYTMLSPFYPDIALRKGVPLWCVGIIFSTDPFCGFFTALVVSKYMNQFGRKNVILWSQVFLAISMFTLSPIQFLDLDAVLLLSFLSRMFAGIGTGCVMTAAASVFASEYPENTPVMIGRMQGAIGIGLIIGPILGTLLVLESLFFALIVLGSLIALLIPISWKMLGEFRPYQIIDTSNTSTFQIFKIPKIILDAGISVTLLFSFGFISPILEIHLLSFHLNSTFVSLCFIFQTISYTFFSIGGVYVFQKYDERVVIIIGLNLIAISYLMLAPWSLIFPSQLWIVLVSLPIMGLGEAMIYVPIYPHMIKVLGENGYAADDLMIDKLSAISNIACNIGEISGPICSGIVTDVIGLNNSCFILSISTFFYAVLYMFGSGACRIKQERLKRSAMMSMKLIVPE